MMTTSSVLLRGRSPGSLAPDPVLPARDVLLDESAVRGLLSGLRADGRAHVSDCTLARVNYQIGKSLRAVFRIVVDGQPHTVAARMFRAARSADAYARACERARVSSGLRPVLLAPEIESVFWLFPNDRKIDTLVPLLESPVPAFLDRSPDGSHPRLVAYAPEKSATLAYDDGRGRTVAYAKVTAGQQAERDYRMYDNLRASLRDADPWLRLPCPLAYSGEHRTFWLEAIHGRRLSDTTGDDDLEDLRQFGSAVAAFHGLSAPAASRFDRFSPAHLRSDAALIGCVRPDVANDIDRLARRLAATDPADHQTVCLHGDLHPKNAIVSGERLALIDVEDVAIGPAAADIGSLLGSLLYLRASQRLSHADFARQADAFLRGYAAVRSLPSPASVAWHTAAALLIERAARAVTRIRPLGLTHFDALLGEAEHVLDRGVALP